MIEHFLLFSRYIGNHGHLWPRDFKQVNEWFYSSLFSYYSCYKQSIPQLSCNCQILQSIPQLKSLGRAKVYTQIYFFIHKLKPQRNIQKTVKIKGCERPVYKFLSRASEHDESIKLQNTQSESSSYHRTHRANLLLRSTKHQSIRAPRETQGLTQITLQRLCKKQRVIALMD